MFGFLKNKLKDWVSGTKDKLKVEEPVEKVEKPKKKKEEKISKSTKPNKVEKVVKGKKDSKKDIIEKKKEIPIKKTKDKKIIEIPKITKEIGKAIEIEEDIVEGIPEEVVEKEKIIEEIEEDVVKTELIDKSEKKKKGFFSRLLGKKDEEEVADPIIEEKEISEEKEEIVIEEKPIEKTSFLTRIKSAFTYKINEEDFDSLFDDLEMLLLENNVALEVVEDLKKLLSKRLIGKEIKKEDLEEVIKKELKSSLEELIIEPIDPLKIIKNKKESPFVILFFGINGTGKTTSIAKLTSLLKKNNLSVVLAAGDTFRAASIEQISEHAKRLDVPLIKHDYNADPSAVGFDAISYAKKHKINVVLIDTAGRMHTKTNLLAEMEKICRVTKPDLKIFVAESIAGNDATEQARTFNEMIGIDGSILSKADIDEKGGTILSVSHITKKPIFYLGVGQNYEDIKLFNKNEFINNLGL
ncbi:MAG: signal recognition particle-docking protein FtsY [Candidatus Pacearchaeota archaeon]|jgi:fused signal recognition particle receptor